MDKLDLRFDENSLRTIIEYSPSAILITKDLQIVDVNMAGLMLSGLSSKDEIIGLTPLDFAPEYQSANKRSEDLVKENINNAYTKGETEFDWIMKGKDDQNILVKVNLILLDIKEKVVLAFISDITENKSIQSRFESIMDFFPGDAYIKDHNLNFLYLNRMNLLLAPKALDIKKYEAGELRTKDLFYEENTEKFEKVDRKLLNEMGSSELVTYIKPSGDKKGKWIRDIKFAYKDHNNIKYIIGLALDISDMIMVNKRNSELKESLINTIQAITESRDPYTAGHEQRVSNISVEIGKVLGLEADRLEGLRIGALLHDLGKVSIPIEILSYPGKLSSAQMAIIKGHTTVGESLLENITFDWPIKDMIRHHHERWNGTGYPDGLYKDETSLEARIIGIADVFEAMSSHRPYRPKLHMEVVIDELKSNSGILYDPDIVGALLSVIEEKNYVI